MPSLPSPCGSRAPSLAIPSPGCPSCTGSACAQPGSPASAAAWQSCRAQRSWAGRRAAQGRDFCQLLHTPAQHPGHSESLCRGTAALRHLHSRKESWLFWIPPGQWAHTWTQHLTLQKDATDEWSNRKKAKTYKTSSWNTYSKMINHRNAASDKYGEKFAGFSFQTLDRQPDPLTGAPKSSCLSKGNLVQGEAQQSLTQAEIRKKAPTSLASKNAKKGEGYI